MCEIIKITKAPLVTASELLVRSDRQFKIERADGTRVHGLLKVLDVLKAAGFEFLNGMRCNVGVDGVFLITEAIYTGPENELLSAINTVTAELGEECVYEDDTYRGCILRLPDEGEASAVEAEHNKTRARTRAKIERERKQEAANARAWAQIDTQRAA